MDKHIISSDTTLNALTLQNISKIYRTYSAPSDRLRELLSGGARSYARETRALDDVSFSLAKGGRLGIVGDNGSGKSTLLKVLAGVLTPTSGVVRVDGRISALLELGAGFNPDLPGRENIRQFCLLHGMHGEEIEEALPEIIAFSELRGAIEHPVKTYSSGMAVRLGFACAVYVRPDILIVDEALSVGDAYFQNKCMQKIKSMLDQGTTFIYVTHAADSIRTLCNEGVWMKDGRVRLIGPSSEVGAAYQSEVFRRTVHAGLDSDTQAESATQEAPAAPAAGTLTADHARHQAFAERVAPLRTGSGEARILDIALINAAGNDTDHVAFGEACRVRVFYRVDQELPPGCCLTLGVTDINGLQILHFNSASQEVVITHAASPVIHVIEFDFVSPLCPGEFGFIAGMGSFKKNPQHFGRLFTDQIVDYVAGGARFRVDFPTTETMQDLWGIAYTPFKVSALTLD